MFTFPTWLAHHDRSSMTSNQHGNHGQVLEVYQKWQAEIHICKLHRPQKTGQNRACVHDLLHLSFFAKVSLFELIHSEISGVSNHGLVIGVHLYKCNVVYLAAIPGSSIGVIWPLCDMVETWRTAGSCATIMLRAMVVVVGIAVGMCGTALLGMMFMPLCMNWLCG